MRLLDSHLALACQDGSAALMEALASESLDDCVGRVQLRQVTSGKLKGDLKLGQI